MFNPFKIMSYHAKRFFMFLFVLGIIGGISIDDVESFLNINRNEGSILSKINYNEESGSILSRIEKATDTFKGWKGTNHEVSVGKVIDGDTFEANSVKYRLLYVDTPESIPSKKSKEPEFYGPEASKFSKEMLEGKTVTISYDKGRTDQYGRTLVKVHLGDGTYYNELLVRQGYAKAVFYDPNYEDKHIIVAAEKKAKEDQLGIWQ